jgi:hypothetical protein|tara:strand:- start:1383 stop:1664 length:282 start_codon:yes stop_codon:yes gene_type:complete
MLLKQATADTGHPITSKIELIEHEDTIGNLSYELLHQDVEVSFDSRIADYIPAYEKGFFTRKGHHIHWRAELINVRPTLNGWIATYGVWDDEL